MVRREHFAMGAMVLGTLEATGGLVVCECTELFDTQTFSEIVGDVYSLYTVLVSPEMIGKPIVRRRIVYAADSQIQVAVFAIRAGGF